MPPTIAVSANYSSAPRTGRPTHAVAAFDQGAVDYVLKPFETERLALACRRVEQRIGQAPGNLADLLRELAAARGAPRSYLRWINASQGTTVRLLTVDEILYLQVDTGYTRVVTAEGEWLIRKSLKELQDELDPSSFWANPSCNDRQRKRNRRRCARPAGTRVGGAQVTQREASRE